MIIHPQAMRREARHLQDLTGVDPFLKLTVHPQALVTTVYHQELNRLREASRGANRHGSCGHGIGETRHYWLKYGRDAIVAADLQDIDSLETKLELLRQRALLDAQEFMATVPAEETFRASALFEPAHRIARELVELGGPINLSATVPMFHTAIFEGAQGVLLDEWRGFHPYTTWSTVTLQHALALVEEIGVTELSTLGITRAYSTRHGAGPLPTHVPRLDATLSDPGNPRNAWQGGIRFGWLDLVLVRYSIDVVGGQLDGVVVNGLDQLAHLDAKLCANYRKEGGELLPRLPMTPMPCLAALQQLTTLLGTIAPDYESTSAAGMCRRLSSEFAPLAVSGSGPTWQDRVLHGLHFRTLRTRHDFSAEPSSFLIH